MILLLRLLWLLGWMISLPWALWQRLQRIPVGTYLLIQVEGGIEEIAAPRRRWPPTPRPRRVCLHALGALIDELATDPRVTGVLIVLRSVRAGFATSAAMRRLMARARAAGKHIVVHLPVGGGNHETYLACAADRILLAPQAMLAPVGILSAVPYVRGALDKIGLVPEVHSRGEYKTAAEPLERISMSEAQREQLEAVVDFTYRELVRAIADGRKVDEAQAQQIVDMSPYTGDEALAAGLVDGVAYEDEARDRPTGEQSPARVLDARPYMRARRALRARAFEPIGAIGVIHVHGAIVSGASMPVRSMAVDDHVIEAVHLARKSPFVRGAVLHVDSPGGGVLASDRIHHELTRLAAKKPLVACLGNVAASGGYYVAAAAHEIVAQPATVTGSIGVVAARVLAEPLLARLGITTQVLARGAHARLLDPFISLDEGSKTAIEREIEATYRAFIQVVARGRNRSIDEIERVAKGRVWVGTQAHAHGLVDRLGGFEDALEAVRTLIGAGAGKLRVVVLRSRRKPILGFAGAGRGGTAVPQRLDPLARALGLDLQLLALLEERVLAWSSVAASIRS